ncbi:hypothetical protein C8Q77DRAFT_1089534 [Trametes polyzona]|nr:hypothetical protein C8Q77DRAFT_1089534 [Trametes polyzona]
MRPFVAFAFACVVIVPSYAALLAPHGTAATQSCPGARIISNTTIDVGEKKVARLSTLSCDIGPLVGQGRTPMLLSPTDTVASCPPNATANVCGATCENTCGQTSGEPFDPDDCTMVAAAASTISETLSQTFTLDPSQGMKLQFGTCMFMFLNESPFSVTNCWLTFAQTATVTARQCGPSQNTATCFTSLTGGPSWVMVVEPTNFEV